MRPYTSLTVSISFQYIFNYPHAHINHESRAQRRHRAPSARLTLRRSGERRSKSHLNSFHLNCSRAHASAPTKTTFRRSFHLALRPKFASAMIVCLPSNFRNRLSNLPRTHSHTNTHKHRLASFERIRKHPDEGTARRQTTSSCGLQQLSVT